MVNQSNNRLTNQSINQSSVTHSFSESVNTISLCTSAALPDLGLSVKELPLLLADSLWDALVDSFLSNSVPSCSLSLDMCDILRIKFTAAVDSENQKKKTKWKSWALTTDKFVKSLWTHFAVVFFSKVALQAQGWPNREWQMYKCHEP